MHPLTDLQVLRGRPAARRRGIKVSNSRSAPLLKSMFYSLPRTIGSALWAFRGHCIAQLSVHEFDHQRQLRTALHFLHIGRFRYPMEGGDKGDKVELCDTFFRQFQDGLCALLP